MNKSTYKELGKGGSFALWDEKKIDDLSMFQDYDSIQTKIKPNIILLGMNMANSKDAAKSFSNFHSSEPKHNDPRLMKAIIGTFAEGAYMTDLFAFACSDSGKLKNEYKNKTKEIEQSVKAFAEKCRKICKGPKYVICIGSGFHYQTVCRYLTDEKEYPDFIVRFKNPADKKKPCFYIPHYSLRSIRYRDDEAYFSKTKELLAAIQKEIKGRA